MPRRIIAGASLLDKLPAWVALPAGVAIGGLVGYWVALPGVYATDVLLGVGVLGLALWWGLSAPRAIPTSSDSSGMDEP